METKNKTNEITSLEFNKNDDESTRQEKNRILVDREVRSLFSYPMAKLQEKELVSFEDIENLYLSDEQILDYAGEVTKDSTEEEKQDVIQNWRDDGQDMQEPLEYWIVSEWFYDKLKEIGEPVIEWEGLHIWGRTCSGQAIALDHTIDKIRELMK